MNSYYEHYLHGHAWHLCTRQAYYDLLRSRPRFCKDYVNPLNGETSWVMLFSSILTFSWIPEIERLFLYRYVGWSVENACFSYPTIITGAVYAPV